MLRIPHIVTFGRGLALSIWALGLLACSDSAGVGRVVGSITVPDCTNDEPLVRRCGPDVAGEDCSRFDLEVDFFAAESTGKGALVRLQRGGRNLSLADGLIIEVRDVRKLRGKLGEPLAVGPDQNIRAALGLFDRCPDSTQSFLVTGVMRFTAFGLAQNDTVAGTIERLEVRDGRPERGVGQVLGVLHGDFRFTVRKGPPYEQFSGG